MSDVFDFLIVLLQQVAGGPGPPENNLVRFGLAAILWGGLFWIAWSRQRFQERPRERLLLWGFGFGLAREILMFALVSARMLGAIDPADNIAYQPLEHGLAMVAIIAIAGAFLRYVLNDVRLSRRYLFVGWTVTLVLLIAAYATWPSYLSANPQNSFHQTRAAWFFHLFLIAWIVLAILALARNRSWLSGAVSIALGFFLLSELLTLLNYTTALAHNAIFCPVTNILHILAIPIFGYVYLREQSIEKRQAEDTLQIYRNHLEQLVDERTVELQSTNAQLAQEVAERKRAEHKIVEHNAQLAAQSIENARLYRQAEQLATELSLLQRASITLTSSLEPHTISNAIVHQAMALLACPMAAVVTWNHMDQVIEFFGSHGMKPSEAAALQAHMAQSGLLCELSTNQQVVAVADIRTDSQFSCAWPESVRVRSLLCVPVWCTDTTTMCLFVMERSARAMWHSREIRLIESFAHRAAIALENAHLHKQLERTAALEERQRIAADMHDGLAQILSALGLKIDQITALLTAKSLGSAADALREIRATVDQATTEVRRSIATLQEASLPRQSLQKLLQDMVSQTCATDSPAVTVVDDIAEPLYLPPDISAQVVPAVQEMLLNAIRHAHARQIQIRLERHGDEACIRLADDGQGFDPHAIGTNGSGHFGLRIMQARADRIGGRLTVDSAPMQGTQICLTWSLSASNTQHNRAACERTEQTVPA